MAEAVVVEERRVAVRTRLLLLWGSAALAAVLLAVALAGAAPQPAPAGLPDAGPLPGWLLPPLRLIGRAAALAVVGLLLLALLDRRPAPAGPVAGAAAVWALAALAELLLGLAEVVALPLSDLLDGALLRYWVGETVQGRGLLAAALLAALLALAAPLGRTRAGAAALLLLALAALAPPLLAGHSAGADSHRLAQVGLVVHVLAAALWVGGVGALALARTPRAAAAFSPLALLCAGAVTASGVLSAALRVDLPGGLLSGYGALLVLKSVLLLGLLFAGAVHRRRTLPALAGGAAAPFLRLADGEAAAMAVVLGLSAALSRTPPPV